jgi:hypothetical protein
MGMLGTLKEVQTMATKKAGRPKGENNRGEGKPVRIDPDIYGKARVIAMRRNLKIGDYISGLLGGPIDRDYGRVLGELSEEGAGK